MGTIAPASADASATGSDEFDLDPDVEILGMLSTETLMGLASDSSARIAREKARDLRYTAEIGKREGWRTEGATPVAWMVERCGDSRASARSYAHVGEQLDDLPELAAGLASGELTFDKVRAVVDVATLGNERELADLARECTVRQLQEVARIEGGAVVVTGGDGPRGSVGQIQRQLPHRDGPAAARVVCLVKSCLETRARELPSDGETRWDQRLCDVYLEVFGSRRHDPARREPVCRRRALCARDVDRRVFGLGGRVWRA